MLDVVELWKLLTYLRRQEPKIDFAWFYFTAVFMKLCFSSFPLLLFFPSAWSHPLPAYHSPQHRLLKLACGVSSRDAETSHTCQVDWRQSRAVLCSLHSLSLCLSLPLTVSLTLSPLSFCPPGSCFIAARITARLLCWWTRLIVNRERCEILSAKELPAWFTVGWLYVMLFLAVFSRQWLIKSFDMFEGHCEVSPFEVLFETELSMWSAGAYRNDSIRSLVSAQGSCSGLWRYARVAPQKSSSRLEFIWQPWTKDLG